MKRIILLTLTFTLLLAACETNQPPPHKPNPPGPEQPDPNQPGPGTPDNEMFNHLGEANWEVDLLKGLHPTAFYTPQIHVNDDGVLFFAASYSPDLEEIDYIECDLKRAPNCELFGVWTINPDGTPRAHTILNHPDFETIFPGIEHRDIWPRATLPAPNGNAYIAGVRRYNSTGSAEQVAFLQQVTPDLEFVGEPIQFSARFDDFVLSDDHTILYHTGRYGGDATIEQGTSVWATSLATGEPIWRAMIGAGNGRPLSIVLNGDEVHVLAESPTQTPSGQPNAPRDFTTLRASDGHILTSQPLPTAVSAEGHPIEDTPSTLIVDAHGKTQMYFQELVYIPTDSGSRVSFGPDITQITYHPDTKTLTRTRIEFFDKNGIRFPPPVLHALADGNVLLAVNSYLNHALVAVNDNDGESHIEWVHIFYPRATGEPQTEPARFNVLAITHHPTHGYYVLANHEDGASAPRYSRYRVINYR